MFSLNINKGISAARTLIIQRYSLIFRTDSIKLFQLRSNVFSLPWSTCFLKETFGSLFFLQFRQINTPPLLAKVNSKGGRKDGNKQRKNRSDEEDEDGDNEAFELDQVEQMLKPPIQYLAKEFQNIKAIRANTGVLENLQVETSDGSKSLSALAQISIKDGQQLNVNLFDEKDVKIVDKAIKNSGHEFSTQIEGSLIKVRLPKMTSEYRESLKKTILQLSEKVKNQVRMLRKKAMDELKKASLPKDEERRAEKDIQKLVDSATKTIQTMSDTKIKEITS